MPQKRVYGTQDNDFLGADGLGTTIIYGLGGDDRLEKAIMYFANPATEESLRTPATRVVTRTRQ